jgi:ethanolamine permease
MAAEEAKDPARAVPWAYIAGILTLVALAFGTMIFAGAVGDWHQLADINDPLPQAMKIVVGSRSGWLHMLVWIGLLGLIASFHGIIMGCSRQIFALARAGFLPSVLATLHPRRKTPHWAIIAGGVIGVGAIYSDRLLTFGGQTLTANIVTLSVFGALTMYIMSMLSLFRLRARESSLERPFKSPFYPYFPGAALVMAGISLLAMIYCNRVMFVLFVTLLAAAWLFYRSTGLLRQQAASDSLLGATPRRSDLA